MNGGGGGGGSHKAQGTADAAVQMPRTKNLSGLETSVNRLQGSCNLEIATQKLGPGTAHPRITRPRWLVRVRDFRLATASPVAV